MFERGCCQAQDRKGMENIFKSPIRGLMDFSSQRVPRLFDDVLFIAAL